MTASLRPGRGGRLVAALVLAAVASCSRPAVDVARDAAGLPTVTAGGTAGGTTGGTTGGTPAAFPGFDTSRYPGDAAMRAWRAPGGSPYVWVGYYLPAPCHRDASWAGTRARLAAMGWGTAVIYVGQQAWEGTADAAPADSGRAVATPIVCSRTLLTAAQGRAEADSAIARAAADGFPRGSVIYLDVEPMSAIPPAMRDYYRAWAGRVLAEGRYRPGVYVHHRNAAAILADMRQVYRDAGAMMGSGSSGIPLWVARQDPGFSVLRAPGESSVEGTRVWQGRINVDESWNGVTLRIDANVADVASPSAPMGGAAPGTR